MSEKQRLKHIADAEAKAATPETFPVSSSLLGAEPTPDGLGTWEGGVVTGVNNWVSLKSRPTRTADAKNAPGKDSSDVVERSVDYFHGKKRDPHYVERVITEEAARKKALVSITQEDELYSAKQIAEALDGNAPTAS